MRKTFAFFSCSFIFLISSAQKSLENGWIQLNNSDTVYGKINEKEWKINPDQINFQNGSEKAYTVSDLISFGIKDGVTYKRFSVIRHLLPYNDNEEYPADENKTDTVTVWLKQIIKAKTSLYALYLANRPYFYAVDMNGIVTELIASKGIKNYYDDNYKEDAQYYKKSGLLEKPVFRNQMNLLFPGQTDKINLKQLDYSEPSLSWVFQKLNKIKDPNNKHAIYPGISAGVSFFTSKAKGSISNYLENAKFKEAASPFVKLSLNFKNANKLSHLSFIPEIGVVSFNTTGTKETIVTSASYDIKNFYGEIDLLVHYIVNPVDKVKLYIDLGISGLLRLSGENTYKTENTFLKDVPKEKSFIIAPSVSAGINISKINVFINYQMLSDITNYVNGSWKVNRISAGVSYLLK